MKNTGAQVTYYGYEDIGIKEGVSFAKPVLVTSVDDASCSRFKNDASAVLFGLLVANGEIQRCGSYTPISGRVYGLSGLEYEPYRVIDIGALEYRSGTSLQVKGVRSDESFGSHDVLGINDDLSLNPTGDVAADNIWRVSSLYLAVMQLSKPVAERVPLSECESIAGGLLVMYLVTPC
ncbi:hypothetical protein I3271_09405 [Photobacterium leiognathi]|uniref:hypothetical protein n=1 Tax=Photobacterium leiognathi TaxID=553611 RepID=UPI001EDEF738|nr:hypothetical protein [Photobacterium leiognathi]MCG3884903.1 hypothetical protein [Photobacterium leiognathi]